MRIRRLSLVVGLASAFAGHAFAQSLPGPASGYNVFIFGTGSFTSQNTDTMGNLAAGGNVNLTSYGVAQGIAGNTSLSPNPARLVVGEQLTANGGQLGSNGQGTIYYQTSGDKPTTSGSDGTFTYGAESNQTLIDFSAATTEYTSLSAYLETLTANGQAVTSAGNTLTLTGTSSGLNVFDVSASTLAGADSVYIYTPASSTVLINVNASGSSGNSAALQTGMVFEETASGGTNEDATRDASVLYNFYEATSVNLGSSDPYGSILAPQAGVVGAYGMMNGQLVAGSYSGNTQFDDNTFSGTLPAPVPLPATGGLLLSALGLLGFAGLRKTRW